MASCCIGLKYFRTTSIFNLPSVQGALCVWTPSAQVSAALARVGSPSATWFFSGRRPEAPSLASAAASELGTRFPAQRLISSKDPARRRWLQTHYGKQRLGLVYQTTVALNIALEILMFDEVGKN